MDQDSWDAAEDSSAAVNFDVMEVFRHGWDLMKRHYGVYLGVCVVYMIISMAIQLAPYIGWFIGVVVTGPLIAGVLNLAALSVRGNPPFSTMFSGFQRFVPTFVIYLLMFVLTMVVVFVVAMGAGLAAASGNAIAMIVAVLLCLGMFIVIVGFSLRFWFAYQLCMMKNLGAIDAYRESWNATRGHWAPLLGLYLLYLLVMLGLTICLFLPAIFVGLPFGLGLAGASYDRLFDTTAETADVFS